jgi:hypothetical protein
MSVKEAIIIFYRLANQQVTTAIFQKPLIV